MAGELNDKAREFFGSIQTYRKVGASFGPRHGLENVRASLDDTFPNATVVRQLAAFLTKEIREAAGHGGRIKADDLYTIMGATSMSLRLNRVPSGDWEQVKELAQMSSLVLQRLGDAGDPVDEKFRNEDELARDVCALLAVYRLRLARRKLMRHPFGL